MSTKVFPVDARVLKARLERAVSAAERAGVDALLIAPGTDLRYLTGAAGGSFERLTCLVVPTNGAASALVVPKLEEPGYAALPLGALGIEVVPWVAGEAPPRIAADLARGGGRLPSRVAVSDFMPALHTLPLRAALP